MKIPARWKKELKVALEAIDKVRGEVVSDLDDVKEGSNKEQELVELDDHLTNAMDEIEHLLVEP